VSSLPAIPCQPGPAGLPPSLVPPLHLEARRTWAR
jgi:hypothetical protein